MNCPKCKNGKLGELQLKTQQGGSLALDQCGTCGGVWFDAGELSEFLAQKTLVLDAPELHPAKQLELDAQAGRCPRCSMSLIKRKSPQDDRVSGDHCSKCGGLWLDGWEPKGLALAQRVNAAFDGWLDKLNADKKP